MPRGVTEQDVFEAADALLARGERPTIERVRQELGSGSPNTINPHLDAWWAALGKRIGGVQAPGLPPAFLQACTRFYQDLQGQALQQAQDALDGRQRAAEAAQQALEAGETAMASEKTALLATIETLRGELARLTEVNQGLTRQAAQHQADVDNARQQANQATEQLRRVQEEHERQAAAARSELERVREQWQGNEARWLGEIDHLRDEVKRQRADHDRTQKGLQVRLQEAEQQLSAGAKERAALRVAVDAAQRELSSEREKRSFAEGALAAGQKQTRLGSGAAVRRRRPRAGN